MNPNPNQTANPKAKPVREWAAHTEGSRRSVFRNYKVSAAEQGEPPVAPAAPVAAETLQQTIDTAVARCFAYRFLALAFQDPDEESWKHLTSPEQRASFIRAVGALDGGAVEAAALSAELGAVPFDEFRTGYVAAFGHAARGRCPINEIEYGDIKADPLFQPHRLADLTAFYHAFGLAVSVNADERQDHLCIELEFMAVLAAKEAYAAEHQSDPEDMATCREAARSFLRQHPGRWVPAFSRRLAAMAETKVLHRLADFTCAFVETDCRRHGVPPGSEDLLLRPIDEAAENLCASCGLGQLPPGAQPEPVA